MLNPRQILVFTPCSMSALGHKQTSTPQKVISALPPKADMCGATRYVGFGPIADIAYLLDHLVGKSQQRGRQCKAKRPRSPQVDDKFEFSWLLHRKIARIGAFENSVHVAAGLTALVIKVHRIRHEAASIHKLPMPPHRRQLSFSSQVDQLLSVLECQYTCSPEQRVNVLIPHFDKGAIEVSRVSYLNRLKCQANGWRSCLQFLQYQNIGLICRIKENGYTGGLGPNPLQDLQSFSA